MSGLSEDISSIDDKMIYYGSVQESRDEASMRIAFTYIPDAGLEGD